MGLNTKTKALALPPFNKFGGIQVLGSTPDSEARYPQADTHIHV